MFIAGDPDQDRLALTILAEVEAIEAAEHPEGGCSGCDDDPGAKRAIQQVLREQEVEVLNEAERLEAEAEALRAEAHRLRVERLGLGPSSHEEADDAAAHRARFDID